MSRNWKENGKNRKGRVKEFSPVVALLEQALAMPVEWLWPGRIVSSNVTMLVGEPDVGKSLLALDLAARVSQGADWPDGKPNGKPGGVLLLSAEDHLLYTVVPVLKAAGANLAKVRSLWEVQEKTDYEETSRPFSLNRDMKLLAAVVEEQKDCKLIVIDPISAYLGGNVRKVLLKLMGLAARYHLAVLGVTHLRTGGGDAMQRLVGGNTVTTAARSVLMVVRDPADETRRLMLPMKNNLADQRTGMAFRLMMNGVETAPQLKWAEEAIAMTANEALGVSKGGQASESQKCRLAMDFLRQTLTDGPRLVKEVGAAAREEAGICHDVLKRARKVLRIKAFREIIPGPWWMRLPTPEELEEEMKQAAPPLAPVAPLAENTGVFEEVQGVQQNTSCTS